MGSRTRYSQLEPCSNAGDAVERFSAVLGAPENTLRRCRVALHLMGGWYSNWTTIWAFPVMPATLQCESLLAWQGLCS